MPRERTAHTFHSSRNRFLSAGPRHPSRKLAGNRTGRIRLRRSNPTMWDRRVGRAPIEFPLARSYRQPHRRLGPSPIRHGPQPTCSQQKQQRPLLLRQPRLPRSEQVGSAAPADALAEAAVQPACRFARTIASWARQECRFGSTIVSWIQPVSARPRRMEELPPDVQSNPLASIFRPRQALLHRRLTVALVRQTPSAHRIPRVPIPVRGTDSTNHQRPSPRPRPVRWEAA